MNKSIFNLNLRCAENPELLKTGLEWAALFANCPMLRLLGETKNISSDILKMVLEEGIKSDSSEAVHIIKTICVAKRFPVSKDVTNLAEARGNTEVMKVLNIAPSDEEMEWKKILLLESIFNKTADITGEGCFEI